MKNIGEWLKQKVTTASPHGSLPVKGREPKRAFFRRPDGNDSIKITFLGGLDHVGLNMAVFETKNDIVVVDCGLQFPEEDMLGIDYVIPDVRYLEERKNKIRGIVITHGHLDHIGGLRYILPKIGSPIVYGSRITIGLIQKQLEESIMGQGATLRAVEHTDSLQLGSFRVEFARVTHNIPGSFAVILKHPIGNIVHTGDFKFDFTAPPPNDIPDFEKFWNIGKEGVLCLLSDSTNAPQDGYAKPEMEVAEILHNTIRDTKKGRMVIASFASNLARLQHVIDSALQYDRKVFLSGRSMVDNMAIAKRLGYVKFPEKSVTKINKSIQDYPEDKVLILTTGSQGEEFSALTRMANDKHAQVQIQKQDTIVFSSHPIPGTGNERSIYNNINKFLAKGAKVITNEDLDVHTTGHGKAEDLRLMIQLTQPKYFIPVHGELFMRSAHKDIAMREGMKDHDVFLLKNGSIIEFSSTQRPHVHEKVLELHDVYIDGYGGTESEGYKVLQERKTMSQDGVAILVYKVSSRDRQLLGAPKLISKGFIYLEELEKITQSVIREAKENYLKAVSGNKNLKQKDLRHELRDHLARFIEKKIGRTPMIIPLIIEI